MPKDPSAVAAKSGEMFARVVARIEAETGLDRLAKPLSEAVSRIVPGGGFKDVLSGTWLGHPLHPMLTDLPIGFWTSAFTLDLLGGRAARPAATRLVGWGVATAVPTALAGASDWSDTTGAARRVGLVHAVANTTATICYGASWWERRRGRHARGVVLALVGATAATVGGYLGGHLLQTRGIGVDNTAFDAPPSDWTGVLAESELTEEPREVDVDGTGIIVFRTRDAVVALGSHCPHRGAPMSEGTLDADSITCPWHGSRFHLPDGALLRGPSATPLPSYECRLRDGVLEVRST
jgi:nitrite reductase/ring-hydroxylating ferredoxin subunit/uncharacterized membrane protein